MEIKRQQKEKPETQTVPEHLAQRAAAHLRSCRRYQSVHEAETVTLRASQLEDLLLSLNVGSIKLLRNKLH